MKRIISLLMFLSVISISFSCSDMMNEFDENDLNDSGSMSIFTDEPVIIDYGPLSDNNISNKSFTYKIQNNKILFVYRYQTETRFVIYDKNGKEILSPKVIDGFNGYYYSHYSAALLNSGKWVLVISSSSGNFYKYAIGDEYGNFTVFDTNLVGKSFYGTVWYPDMAAVVALNETGGFAVSCTIRYESYIQYFSADGTFLKTVQIPWPGGTNQRCEVNYQSIVLKNNNILLMSHDYMYGTLIYCMMDQFGNITINPKVIESGVVMSGYVSWGKIILLSNGSWAYMNSYYTNDYLIINWGVVASDGQIVKNLQKIQKNIVPPCDYRENKNIAVIPGTDYWVITDAQNEFKDGGSLFDTSINATVIDNDGNVIRNKPLYEAQFEADNEEFFNELSLVFLDNGTMVFAGRRQKYILGDAEKEYYRCALWLNQSVLLE